MDDARHHCAYLTTTHTLSCDPLTLLSFLSSTLYAIVVLVPQYFIEYLYSHRNLGEYWPRLVYVVFIIASRNKQGVMSNLGFFDNPPPAAQAMDYSQNPVYEIGQEITVNWTTSMSPVNLYLVQNNNNEFALLFGMIFVPNSISSRLLPPIPIALFRSALSNSSLPHCPICHRRTNIS